MSRKRIPDRLVADWNALLAPVFPGIDCRALDRPSALGSEEKAIFRATAKRSLHFFTTMVLGFQRLGGHKSFHWKMCERLERVLRPQLWLVQREGFKSTISGISRPLWQVASRLDEDTHTSMHTHLKFVSDRALGEQHLRAIKDLVLHRTALHALFPEMEKDRSDWSEKKASLTCTPAERVGSTFEFLTMNEGSAGRHVSSIDMDDLTNENNCESRTTQEQLKERVRHVWPTLDTDDLVVTGTRYKDYDVYGFMIEHYHPKDMDVFLYPARGRAYLNEHGETVWEDDRNILIPHEWDDAKLEKKRRLAADDYIFYCQYMLDTSHHEATGFVRDMFQYHSGALPKVTYYIAADPASGVGTSQPAIAVGAVDATGRFYVVETTSEFASEAEFVNGLFSLYARYQPQMVGVESYGHGGRSIEQLIQREMRNRGVYMPMEVQTHGHSSKDMHIRSSLRPQYHFSTVWHLAEHQYGEYEKQLLAFPGGKYDDLIDAMAYCFQLMLRYGYIAKGDALNRDGDRRRVTLKHIPRGYTLEEMLAEGPEESDRREEAVHETVW